MADERLQELILIQIATELAKMVRINHWSILESRRTLSGSGKILDEEKYQYPKKSLSLQANYKNNKKDFSDYIQQEIQTLQNWYKKKH